MKRMLFNATQAEELRVAIVDGQNLLDLDIETLGKEQRKGNIYKGVITRIEPSLEACFVDYGTDRHGFLPFKEVSRAYFQDYDGGRARIQDVLKEGMQVIVQVEKDERGNKGAALTTFISLAGRYLVLMPNNPRGGGVSRRIEGEDRQELKAAMAELDVPRGMSLIARTAGIGRSVEELQWDFNYLLQLWQAIEEAARAHNEPYLLFMESSLVIRAIRDYFRPDIGEILIDNPDVYEQVSEFMSYVMPGNLNRLKLYEDHTPLFSRFQIEHQIESAFSRSVSLPSGGAIVIDHTEALVSIDVNSARATRGADIEDTAFKTNMEAAEEVARQMRLRDLGGLVVIDFIDMENPKHQRDVENTLRDALKKDRARVQMGKLSRFGLLELSRQRLQPSLGESSHITCPRCAGTGVIRSIESTALHVLRIIQEEAMKDNTGEVHAQVPVDVATFLLNEKRAELFGLEERLDVSVFLIPNVHLENPHYDITRVRTDDVDEDAEPSYKRVAKPQEDDEPQLFGGEKAKTERPEPAVKGVKHTQPAPVVEERKTSWLAGLGAWFKGLFSSGEKAESKPAETERASGSRKPQQRRRQRNPNGARQKNDTAVTDTNQSTVAETPQPARRSKRHEQRNQQNARRQTPRADEVQTVEPVVQAAVDTAAPKAAETAAAEPKRERRERMPRTRVEREQTTPRAAKENIAVADAAVTLPEKAAEPVAEAVKPAEPVQAATLPRESEVARVEAAADVLPETVADDGGDGHREPRRERGGRDRNRNNRDRNRRSDKKRNIPSAIKIEQYLMLEEAAEKVRAAAAHVLGEVPVAETAEEPLVVTIPAPVAPVEAETVAEEPLVITLPAMDEPAESGEAVLFAIEPEDSAPADDETVMIEQGSQHVQAAVSHVLGETAAENTAADHAGLSADLNGLVLVETDPAALQAAQSQPVVPVAPGLRRSDRPQTVEELPVPAEMVQVETKL